MKRNLRLYATIGLTALSLSLAGCLDKEQFNSQTTEPIEKEYNKNDFSTTTEVSLSISYQDLSGIQGYVPFEVYDQMPVDEEYYTKKENIEPIYAGRTDETGNFTQKLTLPAYITKLYIYSSAFYAPALLTADVTNGVATAAQYTGEGKARAALSRATGSYTTSVTWERWLGEFDPATGKIGGYTENVTVGGSYGTQRVSTDDYSVDKMTGNWPWEQIYYYEDPENGGNSIVEKFYNESGNRFQSYPNRTYKYYYRKVIIPTTEERYHPGYAYIYDNESGKADLSISNFESLYTMHSNIFTEKGTCDETYRSSEDLYVNEAAEIAVTMLGGRTCWNSSMGYYYYEEGKKPASLNDAHIILLFPNTQDGTWGSNNEASSYKGVEHGNAVQLYYYPHIASGSQEGKTEVFPAGYRIGFVLATNTWGHKLRTGNKDCYAATSEGLSIKDGKQVTEPRTAVYRNGEAIVFSFEDHIEDYNFSDVVFTMKSNPIDAITDIPDINEDAVVPTSVKGVYAFEDQWPQKGDYDLNDVMVSSHYGKTVNANMVVSETFVFNTFCNYATLKSGLGVVLENVDLKNAEVTLTIDGKEKAITGKGTSRNIFLLSENVKDYMRKDYRLTVKYPQPIIKIGEGSARVFIWRAGNDNKNWELHVAKEAPTELADTDNFFGKEDDLSDLEQRVYYVREGNYPFAFFLAGATQDDISELLESSNESKPIDNVYPKYNTWVEGGCKDADAGWYK